MFDYFFYFRGNTSNNTENELLNESHIKNYFHKYIQ